MRYVVITGPDCGRTRIQVTPETKLSHFISLFPTNGLSLVAESLLLPLQTLDELTDSPHPCPTLTYNYTTCNICWQRSQVALVEANPVYQRAKNMLLWQLVQPNDCVRMKKCCVLQVPVHVSQSDDVNLFLPRDAKVKDLAQQFYEERGLWTRFVYNKQTGIHAAELPDTAASGRVAVRYSRRRCENFRLRSYQTPQELLAVARIFQ